MEKRTFALSTLLVVLCIVPTARAQTNGPTASSPNAIMLDDFESYEDGGLPTKWKYLQGRKLVPLTAKYMRPREKFTVVQDGDNKVLRVYTEGEAVHTTMANESDGFDWDIRTHPVLRWDWRALRLPEGAHEDDDKFNDTGAALYIIFKFEGFIIKRPRAIKYAYSSSLPVGTVVDYGILKVIVVSSGADGIGGWKSIE